MSSGNYAPLPDNRTRWTNKRHDSNGDRDDPQPDSGNIGYSTVSRGPEYDNIVPARRVNLDPTRRAVGALKTCDDEQRHTPPRAWKPTNAPISRGIR